MSLIHFIKSEPDARKIFGKRELEIIQKQVKGLSLTQSEKNRLSRDIRPKFECIKNLAKFENEFLLVKNQENKIIIKKAVDTILENELKENIQAILLFGSLADNTSTIRSDIYIAVVLKAEISLKEATKFRIKISGQLPDKVDIQIFNTLPFKIKKSIAQNHKVLYKSKDFNNLNFSLRYFKDNDYIIRIKKIGLAAK